MFLQQQLNYCHMTFLAGDVECSAANLYTYDICNNESYTSLSPVYYYTHYIYTHIDVHTYIYTSVIHTHAYMQMNTCTCGQSVCDERGPGLLVELHGVM